MPPAVSDLGEAAVVTERDVNVEDWSGVAEASLA